MKRLTVTIAALVWLAGTGIADARPCPRPRPSTEQADAAYSQCIANPMVVAA